MDEDLTTSPSRNQTPDRDALYEKQVEEQVQHSTAHLPTDCPQDPSGDHCSMV